MDFGKFGGLGNLATLASIGGIGKGSNNFLIWLLLGVIVFGFGKGRSIFESGIFQVTRVPENRHHSRRHYRGAAPIAATPFLGLGGLGSGSSTGFLGGNGLFIIVVIALLFICKDKVSEEAKDTYSDFEEDTID